MYACLIQVFDGKSPKIELSMKKSVLTSGQGFIERLVSNLISLFSGIPYSTLYSFHKLIPLFENSVDRDQPMKLANHVRLHHCVD